MPGTLYGIGVGPGDPELLTLKAARLIADCPVISYIQNLDGKSLARDIANAHVHGGHTELPIIFRMSKDRRAINQAYDQAAGQIAEQLQQGQDVAMLCEGDPLFYGSFNYVLERLAGRFAMAVVPGINSVQAVAAATQAPLIMLDQSLAVVSARNSDQAILTALSLHDSIAILKAGPQRPRLLELLQQSGRWKDACYVTRASQSGETIYHSLDQVPNESGDYFGMFLIRPSAAAAASAQARAGTHTVTPLTVTPLIVSLTNSGKALAERITAATQAEHWHKPQPFQPRVREAFAQGRRLILITATGIAMRTLAPLLRDKYQDPAVLVLDEQGRHVIPLLSGHEGGANQWASEIAQLTQGQAVITSARQYLNPHWVAGMGCERNCPTEVLKRLLQQALSNAGLAVTDLTALASIDVKADERGLIALAAELDLPFICYSANELRTVEDQLATPSDIVFREVGCYGVAEGAALLHAATLNPLGEAELILPKQKNSQATVAIARAYVA